MKSICAKFGIPKLLQSPDVGQSLDGDIYDFRIFGQFFINEYCHNNRTSHDIDMKLGPVNKLYNRDTETSKIVDYDVMSTNCDVIVTFPIYG